MHSELWVRKVSTVSDEAVFVSIEGDAPGTGDDIIADSFKNYIGSMNSKRVDNDPMPWTLELSGKDLSVLVMVAVMLVALCFVCARSRGSGVKYQRVNMAGDSESENI